jgi:hypothetical protein
LFLPEPAHHALLLLKEQRHVAIVACNMYCTTRGLLFSAAAWRAHNSAMLPVLDFVCLCGCCYRDSRGRLLAPDATLSDAGVGDGDVVTVVRIELVAEGWKVSAVQHWLC